MFRCFPYKFYLFLYFSLCLLVSNPKAGKLQFMCFQSQSLYRSMSSSFHDLGCSIYSCLDLPLIRSLYQSIKSKKTTNQLECCNKWSTIPFLLSTIAVNSTIKTSEKLYHFSTDHVRFLLFLYIPSLYTSRVTKP